MYFTISLLSPLATGIGQSIEKKIKENNLLNFLHPTMLEDKYVVKIGSGEE